MTRRLLLGSLLGPGIIAAQPQSGHRRRLVSEFPNRLGLFDISDDGAQFAFHRRGGSIPCDRGHDCTKTLHEIQVLRSADRRTLGSLKMTFDELYRSVIAFVPGSGELLLRGQVIGQPEPPAFFLWDPQNNRKRRLAEPPPNFDFISFLERSRVLGTRRDSGAHKTVLWDMDTGAVSEAAISMPWSEADVPLAAAILRTFDGPREVVRELRGIPGQHVYNAAITRSGLLLVISGSKGGNSEQDPRLDKVFISLLRHTHENHNSDSAAVRG
jgi:hypothetical protein